MVGARVSTNMHSSAPTKEAELGCARSWGVCAAATLCVIVPGKRNTLTKPPRGPVASSFIVILILFIAGRVRPEESGFPAQSELGKWEKEAGQEGV